MLILPPQTVFIKDCGFHKRAKQGTVENHVFICKCGCYWQVMYEKLTRLLHQYAVLTSHDFLKKENSYSLIFFAINWKNTINNTTVRPKMGAIVLFRLIAKHPR